MHVIRLTRLRSRGGLRGITQNAISYSLVIAFDTPSFKQSFPLFTFKNLLGTVNPATAQTDRMGRVQ